MARLPAALARAFAEEGPDPTLLGASPASSFSCDGVEHGDHAVNSVFATVYTILFVLVVAGAGAEGG